MAHTAHLTAHITMDNGMNLHENAQGMMACKV
jgi:hypothetical protein